MTGSLDKPHKVRKKKRRTTGIGGGVGRIKSGFFERKGFLRKKNWERIQPRGGLKKGLFS